jgi:hypothetical protein
MRLKLSVFALSTAAVLFGANVASAADGRPYPINYNWHEPPELKATNPPGPTIAVDEIGGYLVDPHGAADASDPNAVRWPTVDRSVWLKTQSQYTIQPR